MSENIELRLGKPFFKLKTRRFIPQTKPKSDDWIDLAKIGPNWWTDPISLCILGFLFPDQSHTKAQMSRKLNLWEQLVDEKLEQLIREGFIHDMSVSFGTDPFGRKKTIRIYQHSERGRFLLHQLDTHFPGLFLR